MEKFFLTDDHVPVGGSFDLFTQHLADSLRGGYLPGSIERLLCDLYSSDPDSIYIKLRDGHYPPNQLSSGYQNEVRFLMRQIEYHVALIGGLWIPGGKLGNMGVHPDVGLQFGFKARKMSYDLTIMGKFARAANPYTFYVTPGEPGEVTRYFSGSYFGFDVGRDIFVRRKHEVQINAGIGLDELVFRDILYPPPEYTAETVNLNFGIGYRYYLKHGSYLGARIKYNILDYSNSNKMDLTGHPFTIHFVIGSLFGFDRCRYLKELGYPQRE